jgi:hypothetical protein
LTQDQIMKMRLHQSLMTTGVQNRSRIKIGRGQFC